MKIKSSLAILLLFTLLSCTTPEVKVMPKELFEKIEIGMSPGAVKKILGKAKYPVIGSGNKFIAWYLDPPKVEKNEATGNRGAIRLYYEKGLVKKKELNPGTEKKEPVKDSPSLITIGMSIKKAKLRLKANGAKSVKAPAVPLKGEKLLKFQISGTFAVCIVYKPGSENKITAIYLCKNPGVPFNRQNWFFVKEMNLKGK